MSRADASWSRRLLSPATVDNVNRPMSYRLRPTVQRSVAAKLLVCRGGSGTFAKRSLPVLEISFCCVNSVGTTVA